MYYKRSRSDIKVHRHRVKTSSRSRGSFKIMNS